MINKEEKVVAITNETLLELSRKGDNKAMLELSKCSDEKIANMWLVRAVLYGNEEARVILRENPERASNLLFSIKNFIPGERRSWFDGSYSAASLKQAGFDELPDLNGSYTVGGLSGERIFVIGIETGEEPPDEDGFGMDIYYDYYVYDEFFHRISENPFDDDSYAAYKSGDEYIETHNNLPDLRFDWLLQDGILKPENLLTPSIMYYDGWKHVDNMNDSFLKKHCGHLMEKYK